MCVIFTPKCRQIASYETKKQPMEPLSLSQPLSRQNGFTSWEDDEEDFMRREKERENCGS